MRDQGEYRLMYAELIARILDHDFYDLPESKMWALIDALKRIYDDARSEGIDVGRDQMLSDPKVLNALLLD